MHLRQSRPIRLEKRNTPYLVIQAQRLTFVLVGLYALYNKVVVEPPAFLQMLSQYRALLSRRIQSIFNNLMHKMNTCLKPLCKGRWGHLSAA